MNNNTLLNRARAAEFLGISLSEFKRREKSGMYRPTLIDQKGWRMYAPDYLDRLRGSDAVVKGKRTRGKAVAAAAEPASSSAPPNYSRGAVYEPEVAAKIFAELDKGLSGREIVQKLLVHPDVMCAVYEAWTRLATMEGGGIHVSGRIMDIINDMPIPGSFPIVDGEGLLANLRESCRDTPMCVNCKRRPKHICVVCAHPDDFEGAS